MNLSIRVEIFKEDDVYVALSPELNVSSFGETIYEAKESIKEAIEAFFEECREMGTLNEYQQTPCNKNQSAESTDNSYSDKYDNRRNVKRTLL